MKKVSVIVPVYKVEEYLDEFMTGLVNQTYRNLEILLVDDGSPDACPQMCDEWAKKDERIRVFHKQNGGVYDARNFALEKATGDYYQFADPDDRLAVDLTEKLVKALENDGTDMAICQFLYLTVNGETGKSYPSVNPPEVVSSEEALELLLKDARVTNHLWRYLFKKELFEGLRFQLKIRYGDIMFTWKLIGRSKKISLLDDILYYYRENPKGLVASGGIKNCQGYYEAIMFQTEGILELYPYMRGKIDNYRLRGGWGAGKESYIRGNKKEGKQFRKQLIRSLSTIPFSNVQGKNNKLIYIGIRFFHCFFPQKPAFINRMKERTVFTRLIRERKKEEKNVVWILADSEEGNPVESLRLSKAKELMQSCFPEYVPKTMSLDQIMSGQKRILKLVKKKDVCLVMSGEHADAVAGKRYEKQLSLVGKLKERRTFFYPQSKDLTEVIKEKNFTDVCMIPEFALFAKTTNEKRERSGALLALRTDSERTLSVQETDTLCRCLTECYGTMGSADPCCYARLTEEQAEKELQKLKERYAAARVVVTDRMSGMILAYLTHTPCLVIKGKNPTILGVYRWISDVPYIRLLDSMANLRETLLKLQEMTNTEQEVDLSEELEHAKKIFRAEKRAE